MKTTTDTAVRSPQPEKGATRAGMISGKLTVDIEVVVQGDIGGGKSATRMQKVLELRRALRNRSYVVDCGAIADALLRRAGRCGDGTDSSYSA